MKTLIAFVFIFSFSALAMSQDNTGKAVAVTTVELNTTISHGDAAPALDKVIRKENNVARLYRFKHSKVLKELTFTTKRNHAKLA